MKMKKKSTSLEFRQQEEGYKIKCKSCNIEMDEVILDIHYPRGILPIKGYKCRKCGADKIDVDIAMQHEKLAERLGEKNGANRRIDKKFG